MHGVEPETSEKGDIMGKVIEVSDRSFQKEVLESDVPVELDFWAPWCGPCRMVAPIYDNLAGEYDNFKFCKINVDENRETAQRYEVMSIPMQLFFADGEKVDGLLGAVPEEVIRSKVQEVLARFPTDERGRLKVILASWVGHNAQDGGKFKRWADKAVELKNDALYRRMLETVSEMEGASERLGHLLKELSKKDP